MSVYCSSVYCCAFARIYASGFTALGACVCVCAFVCVRLCVCVRACVRARPLPLCPSRVTSGDRSGIQARSRRRAQGAQGARAPPKF